MHPQSLTKSSSLKRRRKKLLRSLKSHMYSKNAQHHHQEHREYVKRRDDLSMQLLEHWDESTTDFGRSVVKNTGEKAELSSRELFIPDSSSTVRTAGIGTPSSSDSKCTGESNKNSQPTALLDTGLFLAEQKDEMTIDNIAQDSLSPSARRLEEEIGDRIEMSMIMVESLVGGVVEETKEEEGKEAELTMTPTGTTHGSDCRDDDEVVINCVGESNHSDGLSVLKMDTQSEADAVLVTIFPPTTTTTTSSSVSSPSRSAVGTATPTRETCSCDRTMTPQQERICRDEQEKEQSSTVAPLSIVTQVANYTEEEDETAALGVVLATVAPSATATAVATETVLSTFPSLMQMDSMSSQMLVATSAKQEMAAEQKSHPETFPISTRLNPTFSSSENEAQFLSRDFVILKNTSNSFLSTEEGEESKLSEPPQVCETSSLSSNDMGSVEIGENKKDPAHLSTRKTRQKTEALDSLNIDHEDKSNSTSKVEPNLTDMPVQVSCHAEHDANGVVIGDTDECVIDTSVKPSTPCDDAAPLPENNASHPEHKSSTDSSDELVPGVSHKHEPIQPPLSTPMRRIWRKNKRRASDLIVRQRRRLKDATEKLNIPRRRQPRHRRRGSNTALDIPSKKSRGASWLIPADHPYKITWDVLTILVSLLGAYVTHTSIRDRTYEQNPTVIFCEIWFFTDIVLNFMTQHKTFDGHVLREHKAVWARYLTTWFVVDVISFIPWEYLYVKPIVEMQKRRNIFKKTFFRSKAVVRVTRVLRGRHFKLFGKVANQTKRVSGVGGQRLLRLIIKYVPKYILFLKNMRGALAVRTLRQIHWFRKVMKNFWVHKIVEPTKRRSLRIRRQRKLRQQQREEMMRRKRQMIKDVRTATYNEEGEENEVHEDDGEEEGTDYEDQDHSEDDRDYDGDHDADDKDGEHDYEEEDDEDDEDSFDDEDEDDENDEEGEYDDEDRLIYHTFTDESGEDDWQDDEDDEEKEEDGGELYEACTARRHREQPLHAKRVLVDSRQGNKEEMILEDTEELHELETQAKVGLNSSCSDDDDREECEGGPSNMKLDTARSMQNTAAEVEDERISSQSIPTTPPRSSTWSLHYKLSQMLATPPAHKEEWMCSINQPTFCVSCEE